MIYKLEVNTDHFTTKYSYIYYIYKRTTRKASSYLDLYIRSDIEFITINEIFTFLYTIFINPDEIRNLKNKFKGL